MMLLFNLAYKTLFHAYTSGLTMASPPLPLRQKEMQRAARYKVTERNATGLSSHSDAPSRPSSKEPPAAEVKTPSPTRTPGPKELLQLLCEAPQGSRDTECSLLRTGRGNQLKNRVFPGGTRCSGEGLSRAQEGQECGSRPRMSFLPVPSHRDHRGPPDWLP